MKSLHTIFFFLTFINFSIAQTINFSKEIIWDDNPYIKTENNTFEGNDPIYGVIQFENSIMNTPITDNPGTTVQLGYFVTINGKPIESKEVGSFAIPIPGAMFTREYNDVYDLQPITLCLIPSESDRYKSNVNKQGPYRAFSAGLAEAGIGAHEIEVSIRFMDGGNISEPIAKGKFTLILKSLSNFTPASRFPAAKKTDAALETSMKKALKDGGWDYQVKKINIVETEWEIHRNNFGYITKRTIDTYTAFTLSDGSCKVFNLSFKQDYNGGTYGTTQVNGTGQSYLLDCKEIK